MSAQELTDEDKLAELMLSCANDPQRYALIAFPWGEEGGPLEKNKAPRQWQGDTNEIIRAHLSCDETRYEPLLISIASGHGIGKSAEIGMIINWALDTCVDTRIIVTSNTESQLRTKTVPEVQKWSRMSITANWKTLKKTSIASADKQHMESWRADFVPWSKDNSEAFAGLHNQGKRIVVIFDEASGIDDVIWEVTEGALTDEDTEIIWIAFGNPTRNVGRFRECFRKFGKYWNHRHIDSRTVEGTNKKLFKRWEEQYGEDSDFFKVRVRGIFPELSVNQLFPTKLVDSRYGKHLREDQYNFAAKIISLDGAWQGDDDVVIGMRQGLHYQRLAKFAKNTNDVEVANMVARLQDEHKADGVIIDGAYGTGVVSVGRTMGRNWLLVWFGGASDREDCMNKRAEMHVKVREWLQAGGVIPPIQELYDEMVACETVPRVDGKYQLMPKKDMKELIGRSPGDLDALAITFAFNIEKQEDAGVYGVDGYSDEEEEYDPWSSLQA